MRVSRRGLLLLAALTVVILLRLPSLIEPHWYSDESTYAYVGRTLFRGHALYRGPGAWDNKPPLQYAVYGALGRLFGSGEFPLHLTSLLAGLAAVTAVWWGLNRLASSVWTAMASTLMAAILIGLPIFDADLLLPESLLIAPLSWGAIAILVKGPAAVAANPWRQWWLIIPVVLFSCALAIQQTAVADIAAMCMFLVFLSPRRPWLACMLAAGVGTLTASWLLPTIMLSGFHNTVFALVGFYSLYAHWALPRSASARRIHFAGLALVLVCAAVGAVWCSRVSRRSGVVWGAWLWAACELFVPAADNNPYPHLLLPTVVPVMVALAVTPWARWRGLSWPAMGASAVLAASIVTAVPMARVAGANWATERSLIGYYKGGYTSLFDPSVRSQWQASFSWRLAYQDQTAAWLRARGWAGSSAVCWCEANEWLYLLADLHTTLPTVALYNDTVLLHGRVGVARYLASHRPRVMIVGRNALRLDPYIKPVLVRYYRAATSNREYAVYLERDSGRSGGAR